MNTRAAATIALSLALVGCDEASVSGCLGPLCFVGSTESACDELGHCLCPTADTLDAAVASTVSAVRATARSCGTLGFNPTAGVAWNATLDLAATNHADDMRAFQFTDPTGSDGLSVTDRVAAVATPTFPYDRTLHQLVAEGKPSLDAVINTWLDTPAACASLMAVDVSQVGIACAGNTAVTAREPNRWSLVLGGD
ncbi:MAG: CAP domain-containing protein [Pseudomonadota bacterium]